MIFDIKRFKAFVNLVQKHDFKSPQRKRANVANAER